MISRFYKGTLYHCRHRPKVHRFQYQVFMPLVDLAKLPELVDPIPFWSARRFALAQFKREDFLGDASAPLIDEVRRRIKEETGVDHRGKVFLLANWRYFGFQTNPIACYFCFDEAGEVLQFLVAEVTNTPWGERHSYVLTAPAHNATLATEFNKAMHVSPFNPMAMTYRWYSTVPGDTLAVKLSNFEDGERVFDATLNLVAQPFNAKTLSWTVLKFPFMTMKVFAGIYWQALRLWLKGVPFHAHPNSS